MKQAIYLILALSFTSLCYGQPDNQFDPGNYFIRGCDLLNTEHDTSGAIDDFLTACFLSHTQEGDDNLFTASYYGMCGYILGLSTRTKYEKHPKGKTEIVLNMFKIAIPYFEEHSECTDSKTKDFLYDWRPVYSKYLHKAGRVEEARIVEEKHKQDVARLDSIEAKNNH